MSIISIQYALKYVHKGCDMADFGVQDSASSSDEIAWFLTGRFLERAITST